MYAPTRKPVPLNPPDVQTTIRLTKRIQVSVILATTTGLGSLRVADLASGIPGGSSYWNSIRITAIDVWSTAGTATAGSTDGPPLQITVDSSSSWSQPPVTWIDSGTSGQERPRIGFTLGLLDQARFFGTADTTELFSAKGPPNTTLVVQCTVELVSPSLVQ